MATNTTTNPTPEANLTTGGIDPNALLASVVQKQMDSAGLVSSTNSDLDATLQKAIAGYQTAADKSNQAVTSSYDRQISDATEQGANDITSGRASGNGGLLNIAALRELTNTTDKNLKDLEQRKQELILQNDAQAATKISDLQFQAVQFRQQAQQQVFSNLLGIANLGIQSQAEQRLAKQANFQEKQSISAVALQYGLKVAPGETLESITTKAMPFASQMQQAQLAKLQSEISVNRANAAKALQGDTSGVNSGSIPTLVDQALRLEAAGKDINDPEYANLLGTVTKAGQLDNFYKQKAATQKAVNEQQLADMKATQEAATKAAADAKVAKTANQSAARDALLTNLFGGKSDTKVKLF